MCNWSQLVIFDLPVGFCQHAGITPKIAGLTAIPIPNLKGGCWCRRCYDIPGGKSSDSVHSYGKCFEECLWNPTNQGTKEGKLWLSELVSAVFKKITKVALKSLNHLQVKLKTPDIDPFLHSTICSTIGSENDICPMDPVRVHSTNAYIYVYIYILYIHIEKTSEHAGWCVFKLFPCCKDQTSNPLGHQTWLDNQVFAKTE